MSVSVRETLLSQKLCTVGGKTPVAVGFLACQVGLNIVPLVITDEGPKNIELPLGFIILITNMY